MQKVGFIALCCWASPLFAQLPGASPLFKETAPLSIGLKISFSEAKDTKSDSSFIATELSFKNKDGAHDSVRVKIKARGHYRLQHCYFPPLKVKIQKSDAKGTVFQGNRNLKLVLPCQRSKHNNTPLLREFLCYKIYEQVAPYYFNTRLVEVDLVEIKKSKRVDHHLKGILIEDADDVAKRYNAKVIENKNIHPRNYNDTTALRFELFEFLIANTDWSMIYEHNSNTFFKNGSYIPVPYDFDMSGLVNAPYAVVDVNLSITQATDRLYRGFCRAEPIVNFVRKDIIEKEKAIFGVVDQYASLFSEMDVAETRNFLKDFFEILKDDAKFKEVILSKCRTDK